MGKKSARKPIKKTARKRARKTAKKRGGILIKGESKKAFYNFLQKSSLNYVTSGANGFIFKASQQKTDPSPYRFIDISEYGEGAASKYGEPVKDLLIKFVFLDDKYAKNRDFNFKLYEKDIQFSTKQNFIDEVNTQVDIYMKSIKYLQPICPAIVYSEIMDMTDNNRKKLFELCRLDNSQKNENENEKENINISILRTMLTKVKFNSIGIIGMEYVSNSNTAFNYYTSEDYKDKNLLLNACLYLLIELAMTTGYTQGDFHLGNFLISPDTTNYFYGYNIRPILIDFGYSKKILPKDMVIINNFYKKGQYMKIIEQLCDIGRKDSYELFGYDGEPNFYGLTCNADKTRPSYEDYTGQNQAILELIDAREQAININTKKFNARNINKADILQGDLMPLETIRKYLYDGIINAVKFELIIPPPKLLPKSSPKSNQNLLEELPNYVSSEKSEDSLQLSEDSTPFSGISSPSSSEKTPTKYIRPASPTTTKPKTPKTLNFFKFWEQQKPI